MALSIQWYWARAARRYFAFLLLVAGAAGLRFAALNRQPLWLDEASDAFLAAQSLWDCVLADPVHPPLYRGLLHLMVSGFGDSIAVVRTLPAIFGILTVPAMTLLSRRLFAEAQLSAAALAATSPFLVFFSQENRNYSLFILLTVLSTWAFLRFQDRRRGLPLYCGLSILLIYTHYLAAFVLLAHEVVYWRHGRQCGRDWLLARGLALVSFLPWFYWVAEHYRAESRLFLSPVWLIPVALLRFALGYGVAVFDPARPADWWSRTAEEAPVLLPSLWLFGWLLWRGAGRANCRREVTTLFVAILLVPWAMLLLLAPWIQLAQERYLSFQAPFILLLAAAGLCSLGRAGRLFATLSLAVVVGFSLTAYYGAPGSLFGYRLRYAKENWAGAAAFLREQQADTVILAPGYLRLALRRYELGKVRLVESPPESSERPDLTGARRMALVISHTDPAQEHLRAALDACYPHRAERVFLSQNWIDVIVYDVFANPQEISRRWPKLEGRKAYPGCNHPNLKSSEERRSGRPILSGGIAVPFLPHEG